MKIIDNQNRAILSEGRNNGMGFAFLKKIEENTFETVQPISPCKDYLNEPVFTEKFGFPTKAFGLNYEKLNILDDNFYMVIKIMKSKADTYGYSPSFENDILNLKNNYKNIELIINTIEERIGIKDRTKIIECENDEFLIIGALDWVFSTIAISLFSLLVRCSFTYTGKETPMDFLTNFNYHNEDKNLLNMALGKLKTIEDNQKLPEQPAFDESSLIKGYWSPHDTGILSWDSKYLTQTSN